MGKLEGKVALITGASGGIGSAVTKRFIKEGARVILIARSLDNLKQLYEEITKLEEFKEDYVKLIQLDLLDLENVKFLPNRIENLKLSESGALDILVSCVGILGKLSSINDLKVEEFQEVININFTANWYLLKNLDPMLKKSDAGRMIFVTSDITSSPDSFPYRIPYAASKAALETMIKTYSSETKHTKLCVNAVYPADPVDTRMYREAFPTKDTSELISPDELTDKFVELASEGCNVTGEVIPLSKSSNIHSTK